MGINGYRNCLQLVNKIIERESLQDFSGRASNEVARLAKVSCRAERESNQIEPYDHVACYIFNSFPFNRLLISSLVFQ